MLGRMGTALMEWTRGHVVGFPLPKKNGCVAFGYPIWAALSKVPEWYKVGVRAVWGKFGLTEERKGGHGANCQALSLSVRMLNA